MGSSIWNYVVRYFCSLDKSTLSLQNVLISFSHPISFFRSFFLSLSHSGNRCKTLNKKTNSPFCASGGPFLIWSCRSPSQNFTIQLQAILVFHLSLSFFFSSKKQLKCCLLFTLPQFSSPPSSSLLSRSISINKSERATLSVNLNRCGKALTLTSHLAHTHTHTSLTGGVPLPPFIRKHPQITVGMDAAGRNCMTLQVAVVKSCLLSKKRSNFDTNQL